MAFPTTQYINNPANIVVPYVWSDASGKYIPQKEAGSISLSGISLNASIDQVGISGDVSLASDTQVGVTGEVSLSPNTQVGISGGQISLTPNTQVTVNTGSLVRITGGVEISEDVTLYNPTGVNFGQLILAGTQQQVTSAARDGYVYLKAHSGNSHLVMVGTNGVNISNGYPLYPQDELLLSVDGINKVYLSGQNNNVVSYILTY